MKAGLISRLLDMISPRTCPVCGSRLAATEDGLCGSCQLQLPYTNYWLDPAENAMAQRFWGLAPVERAAALFFYSPGSYESAILYRMKYYDQPQLARTMGRLIGGVMTPSGFFTDIDAIVPVPLSKKRRRERGYNQSEMLAEGLSLHTGLPVIADAVKRLHFHGSQTRNAGLWERRENVDRAFAVAEKCSDGSGGTTSGAERLKGKHLLMVDDVVTTGSTCLSCMQAIIEATTNDVTLSVVSLAVVRH